MRCRISCVCMLLLLGLLVLMAYVEGIGEGWNMEEAFMEFVQCMKP